MYEKNINFEYVLEDSWYSSKENMGYISENLKKKFVLGLKTNRLFKMYDKNSDKWTGYSQLKNYELKADRSYLIYPSGIILHKHNTDNQPVTYNFNLIFKGDQYKIKRV